jgi:hypothetical protein
MASSAYETTILSAWWVVTGFALVLFGLTPKEVLAQRAEQIVRVFRRRRSYLAAKKPHRRKNIGIATRNEMATGTGGFEQR